jgi:hypothetical protein
MSYFSKFSPLFSRGACLLAALSLISSAHAQRYLLKNGPPLNAADVTLSGGFFVQQIPSAGGGTVEKRFPLADLVRLDFPEPEELETAESLVAAGKGEEALQMVQPIYRQFAPFAKIPGSYWPRAAELRLKALLLGTDNSAITSAARELMQSGLGQDIVGTAKLALAQLDARANRESLANIMIEEILREATPAVQAQAWLLRGDLAAKRSAHIEALEAYLRIPAFYGTMDELMPAALLGAARAYKGYGDNSRAERSALELIDTYPASLQATQAKKEFSL